MDLADGMAGYDEEKYVTTSIQLIHVVTKL